MVDKPPLICYYDIVDNINNIPRGGVPFWTIIT